MLNFNSILVFSEKPQSLADFYEKVFDKKPDWKDDNYSSFNIGSATITIGPHDKIRGKNKFPERIIFNFETGSVREEFERIKELGAVEIASPYSMNDDKEMLIATLADPDGNYFQLISPWKKQKEEVSVN